MKILRKRYPSIAKFCRDRRKKFAGYTVCGPIGDEKAMSRTDRVVVGLSGGVDSAVCAYLLKAAGYEVIGVTLRTWVTPDGKDSRCCEIDDARRTADLIGIPYYAVNCISNFKKNITEPFISEYINGLTPNPCVICNRSIKWKGLLEAADHMDAQYIATGHYAQIVRTDSGRFTVMTAEHSEKDQTYMLYRLTQEQLSRTLMPLGKLSKSEVRRIARHAGLPVFDKPDSQEICFVTEGSHADFIEEYYSADLPPSGDLTDLSGKTVGRHKGIYHYTVGQRKGLGISLGYPAYVTEIDPVLNRVVLADEASLYKKAVMCRDVNFMSVVEMRPGDMIKGSVKIRYHHAACHAQAEMLADGRLGITFEDPIRAPAKGQSAVMYDKHGCVICGGIIDDTDQGGTYHAYQS